MRPCTMMGQGKLTLQSCSATSVRLCTSSLAGSFTPVRMSREQVGRDDSVLLRKKSEQAGGAPHIPFLHNPWWLLEEEDEEGIRCSMHRRIGS